MEVTKNSKVSHVSRTMQIWIFISFMSFSYGNGVETSRTWTITPSYTMENNTQFTVNVTMTSTTMSPSMSSYSVPVSATPPLPSYCSQVCRCNSSVAYATTMVYNTMSNATLDMDMTSMPANMTSLSVNMSTYSMNPTQSSMTYSASANVTDMSYNSSVLLTPSSAVSMPFVCPNESCWVEIECMSHFPRNTMTISPSLSTSASMSASVAPPGCSEVPDCNGDCGGSAYRDCDLCIEGNSGRTSSRDCGGICNGTAYNSTCGICLDQGVSDPFLDCNDTCFGEAAIDSCGVCTGGNTRKVANYLMDECGVCNGTNTTCAGCDGIPNSGLVKDACGVCGGDGSTCTEIMATMPQTIASSQPTVWVIGAGLNGGTETVCGLYDPESGDPVVNTTASERNLTHARCEFQPWVNYTAGVYNLSVTIVHDDQADVRTNNSLPVYYYSSQDLSLTSVLPDEVLKDDLPQHVTLNGSGFFDWKETVCYFDSQKTRDVIYINETHLQCKVAAVSVSTRFSVSLSMDGGLVKVGATNLTVFASAPDVTGVKFSDTAGQLLVDFDRDVEVADADESCELFFTSGTVSMLGAEPECFLADTRELVIVLGFDATITTDDDLVFNNNVLKAHSEQYSRYLNGSFPVSGPDTPLKATPVITGLTRVGV